MKKLLALFLVLMMLVSLAACGDKGKKIENPNLITIGDYQALFTGAYITKDYEGDDAIAASFTYTNNSEEAQSFLWAMFYTPMQAGVELENSTIFKSADSYDYLGEENLNDVAPGASQDVVLTYKLRNLTDPVTISFSDLMDKDTGEITIDVTKLEIRPTPDSVDSGEATPEADGPATYKLLSFTADGQEMGSDMVELMGGGYIIFNGDGTGTFAIFGDVFPITYDGAVIGTPDGDMAYTLTADGMEFDMGGDIFKLELTDEIPDLTVPSEDEEADSEPIGYAFDGNFAAAYSGDWHGMAEFYDCTGDYSDEDELQAEIIARFVFDEDGYCIPYIRLCLSQEENENFVIDSMDYDAEYDCMLINGTLSEKPLDPIESFVELEGEVLYIGASYDDGSGDVFNILGCLRRLDDQWDYENDYPYLPQDGVEFYAGMTMEEIVELYGYDVSLLPSLTDGPADSGKQEEEPTKEEKPADPELPFETGIASGDGIVELQQLKDFKDWIYSVNTYENNYYKPTYEECLEQMGVDPAPSRPEKWEDDYVTYVWSTADGTDKLTLTLQPAEDGSGWIYKAISFTGGVNS